MVKKDLGLSKLKYFTIKVVRQIAGKHLTLFKRRVTEQGQDYKGKKFPEYSDKYKKLKSGGMKKKDGGRLKGFGGIHTDTEVGTPNFKLRGLTMLGLRKREERTDSYKIGWDGEAGAIVDGQSKKGRDVASGIPDKEHNRLVKWFGDSIEKQHKHKLKNIKVVVGK